MIKVVKEPPAPPDVSKLGKRAAAFLNETFQHDLKTFEKEKTARSNKTAGAN